MPSFKKGSSKYFGTGIVRETNAGTFVAEFNSDGKRRRKTHKTPDAAEQWLKDMGATRYDEGKRFLSLTGDQADDAQQALNQLSKANIKSSLKQCTEFYIKHHAPSELGTVRDWYGKRLARMEYPENGESPSRPRTIQTTRNRLSLLVERIGDMPIQQVTKADVIAWLELTGAKNRDLKNYKIDGQAFFNFIERESQGEFQNTVAIFPQKKQTEVAPAEIMRPTEVRKFLRALEKINPRTALAFAIGCFAGLRRTELSNPSGGICWEHIDFEEEEIRVPASLSKTRKRRDVKITPNLMEWLLKYQLPEGRIAPDTKDMSRYKIRAEEKTGIKWVNNGARHSFGTFYGRLHGYRDAADLMGHRGTMDVFEDHYKGESVRTADAKKYFEIKPANQGKVISIKGAA